MKALKTTAAKALCLLLIMTLLCGLAYPLAMTGLSQLLFRRQANGSIIEVDGTKYGSILLAQEFTGTPYLWGRVMNVETEIFTGSSGEPLLYAVPSNKSPASAEYQQMIAQRVQEIREAHPEKGDAPIPVDLVTCSGSGLDPHISPAAAEYQVQRIAAARGMDAQAVRDVIAQYTAKRAFGFLGEPTVNVLQVNLALDGILKGGQGA